MRRMLTGIAVLLVVALAFIAVSGDAAQAMSAKERIDEAAKVLREMSEQTDIQSMVDMLRQAEGVAIFPSVIKAGLMLGGRYGEGLVLRYDSKNRTWYGPSFVTIKGLSYGLQFGVQSTALVLVITNERGMDTFMGGDKVTLGGDLSVAAGPLGRHAEAGTDLELKASIYSYSMSKGIFAGMSLEGAVITVDEAANREFWGRSLSPQEILKKHRAAGDVESLTGELNRLLRK